MTFGMPLSQWFNKNFTPLNPSIFGQCWQIYLLLATELWPIDFIITKSSYCSSHLLQGCQRLQDVLFFLFHLLENPDAHVLKYLGFFCTAVLSIEFVLRSMFVSRGSKYCHLQGLSLHCFASLYLASYTCRSYSTHWRILKQWCLLCKTPFLL